MPGTLHSPGPGYTRPTCPSSGPVSLYREQKNVKGYTCRCFTLFTSICSCTEHLWTRMSGSCWHNTRGWNTCDMNISTSPTRIPVTDSNIHWQQTATLWVHRLHHLVCGFRATYYISLSGERPWRYISPLPGYVHARVCAVCVMFIVFILIYYSGLRW